MTQPLYLDYQATTPLDPRVRAAMDAFLDGGPANPHSATHGYGWRAAAAVDEARRQVAALVGARPEDLIFTSGASEANNLAILGAVDPARGGRIVCSAIEHPSVLMACRHLSDQGVALDLLPVDSGGLVDPAGLKALLRPETRLVSVMVANNEIGSLQPVAELAAVCRAAGVLFHCDAAQAAGKVPVDFTALGCDLMSLSAHKLYGPMGIGALAIRPGVQLRPLFFGGAQERGLRPGTLPAPLAVGFGEAAQIALEELADEPARLTVLRERLLAGLQAALPDLVLHGSLARRLPGNLNVALPGLAAEDWILACPGLALSSGAACASGKQEPSPVLSALGLDPAQAAGAVRIGLGRFTDDADVERALAILVKGASQAR